MAIRRCPYCKAIIDEGLEYCSNCGTQLIFPEDEFVEEEIPGEKIVDVSDEEVESEEKESTEESTDLAAATDEIITEKTDEIDEDKVEIEGSEFTANEDLEIETSEMLDAEERTSEEEDIIPDTEETFVETGEIEEEPEVELKSEEIEEKIEAQEDFGDETSQAKAEELLEESQNKEGLPVDLSSDYLEQPGVESIPDSEDINQVEDIFPAAEWDTGEINVEKESVDFKTEDLERLIDPAEKEKEEIEEFLNSLKEEREKTKKYYEETGELPPWAQSMKEGSLSSIANNGEPKATEETVSPEEKKLIEEEKPPAEKILTPADTGMGLPEGIDQKGLPFNQDFHEEETEEMGGPSFRYKDMNFLLWIKSRVFDVLMIAGIWLVTVWLASIVAKASFSRLITASTIPILIFLAILLTVYFFLFYFFLGETLGDQMFSQEE